MRIALLISNTGTGTNLQAIIDGIDTGKIEAEICAVISDTVSALGLERARKHNLKIEICPAKEVLLPLLQKINPDFICFCFTSNLNSFMFLASLNSTLWSKN